MPQHSGKSTDKSVVYRRRFKLRCFSYRTIVISQIEVFNFTQRGRFELFDLLLLIILLQTCSGLFRLHFVTISDSDRLVIFETCYPTEAIRARTGTGYTG